MTSDIAQEIFNAETLLRQINDIEQLCSKRGIACMHGSVEHGSASVVTTEAAHEWLADRVERLCAQGISIKAVILATDLAAREFKQTVFWNNKGDEALRLLVGTDRPVDRARKMHQALAGKPVALSVILIADGLHIIMRQATIQQLIFAECEAEETGVAYQHPLDDDDDDWDEELPGISEERASELAGKLAREPGFGLARNRDQRRHFAEKHLATESDFDEVTQLEIYSIGDKAKVIFDMEVLPKLVCELADQGVSNKDIATKACCSANKVKSILSQRSGC
jgi:hypothetical protein